MSRLLFFFVIELSHRMSRPTSYFVYFFILNRLMEEFSRRIEYKRRVRKHRGSSFSFSR